MAESDFRSEPPEPRRRPKPVKRRRPADYDDDYDDDRADYDDDPVQTIVPYKNVRALLAYYCGIFSLIPIAGFLIGPAAILLGILGYRYGSKNPSAKGAGHAVAGIVFGVIGVILSVVVCYFVMRYAFGWDNPKMGRYRT
jgi:hypothetical protein